MNFEKRNNSKKCRKRQIIWFNPPYNKNVTTNIGKLFFNLIEKHFPKHNKLSKIFNRNNVKISYSCMPNMQNIIKQHNNKILNAGGNEGEPGCNCRQGIANCPLAGQCLVDDVVYEAAIVTKDDTKFYIGSCSTTFKLRYADHTSSFRNIQHRNKTELSSHIWQLKEKNLDYKINWKILTRAKSYKNGKNWCKLCLTEKMKILKADRNVTINKLELMTKCLHKFKFKMKKVISDKL